MHKNDPSPAFRHGAYERLRFIEDRLFWEARINRADLIDAFGISPAQAAIDFREYANLAGDGVSYDRRAKAYIAAASFKPVIGDIDAKGRLAELAQAGDAFTVQLPQLDRSLPVVIAARLRRAARDGHRILIEYQSMTRQKPNRRWIAPSRLVSDGERWHARAWCYERKEWRDFVLARILSVGGKEPAGEVPHDDEWDTKLALVLRPASRLSADQKSAVAREYGMKGGTLKVVIPKPLRLYAVRRWSLDHDDARLEIAEETIVSVFFRTHEHQ